MQYSFTKSPCAIDRLAEEIRASSITVAFDYATLLGADLVLYFKGELSESEQSVLSSLVTAHSGQPLPQNTAQPVSVQAAPPYGSKTITVSGATKKLYARNVGIQQALSAGSNTITYTASYAWVKMLGVEAINCEALDTVSFKVYDNASGTYSGYPNLLLNQFSFSLNLPKDYYLRMANFDADVYAGMVIKVEYTSVSAKTVGLNFLFNEVK